MLQVAQMAGQDGPLAGHAVHAAKTSPHAAVPVGLRLKQVAPPQHGTPRTLAWKWRRSMPLLTAASRRHLSAGSAKTGQQGGELFWWEARGTVKCFTTARTRLQAAPGCHAGTQQKSAVCEAASARAQHCLQAVTE